MRKEVIEEGSIWQHFKGDTMKVIKIVKHSESLEDMVLYEHYNQLWIRPITSFLSDEDISEREDNKTGQKYRFEKIN